ncbi:MAG: polysaccharide biosynthesis protein, partial [Photobacterium aquimaris]|nr:polysaccharide biosynthesis protein [Photobacterium aquimaris]
MQRLNFIWQLSRFKKRVISVSIDTLLIVLALHIALWTRLGDFQFLTEGDNLLLAGLTVITTVAIFTKIGLYRAVLRYLTFQALFVVTAGALLSAISLAVFAYYLQEPIPRTVPIIYCAYLALLCGGSRLVVRNLVATTSPLKDSREEVLIYGAGSGGR